MDEAAARRLVARESPGLSVQPWAAGLTRTL